MPVTRFVVEDGGDAADTAPGVVGNSRLTSSTGLVLAVLLLIEGFTILDVRGYITLHTIMGLLLIGPVALKCATTIYRFARYYAGGRDYVRRGAPPLLFRVIGPLLVLSSVAVLATGVVLLAEHGRDSTMITLHQASFIVWVVVTGLHFLGHLNRAVRETVRELHGRSRDGFARGRGVRLAAVAAALLVGIGLAAAFTPTASSWHLH